MEIVFIHIIPLAIKSVVFIPLVLLLRFLIRKQPKIYTYPLWIMVFLGLIFDFSISVSSSKSISNPVAQIQQKAVDGYNDFIATPYGETDIHYRGSAEFDIAKRYGNIVQIDHETGAEYVSTRKGSFLPRETVFSRVFPAAYLIWATVCVNMYLCFFRSVSKLNKNLAGSKHHKDNIYFAENIPSPFVYGIIRPKIYIPLCMENRDISHILLHEKMHIRHKDNIIKPACFLICIMHWFNPLAWICYRMMCTDIEMACDETVINYIGLEYKKDYSIILLDYASGMHTNYAMTIMFGESHAEKRIKNILRYKKPTAVVAVALTAFIIIGCIAPVITTTVTEKTDELTFSQQLKQVAAIDNVQYKYRTMVYGVQSQDYWGNVPTDGNSFKTLYNNPGTIEKVSVRNQIAGCRVDDHPDGMFYHFLFLMSEDDTFTHYYRFLNSESRGGGGGIFDRSYQERIATKAISADYISDDLCYEVFYSKEKYTGYDEQEPVPQLTIKKTYTVPKSQAEYLNDEFRLIKDFNSQTETVSDVYYLSADRVGDTVTSVRFLNDKLGFLAHSKDGYTDSPQAMITIDGGATWLDMDFSKLTMPQQFTAYRSAFLDLYGETVTVYLDVQYTDGEYSTEKQHPYRLISHDCGKTWSGYFIEEKMEPEMGIIMKVPVQATDIISAAIK